MIFFFFFTLRTMKNEEVGGGEVRTRQEDTRCCYAAIHSKKTISVDISSSEVEMCNVFYFSGSRSVDIYAVV